MTVLKRLVDAMLSIGEYPGEPETQRSGRRILVAAVWIANLLSIPSLAGEFDAGYYWSAWGNVVILAATAGVFIGLRWKPLWFPLLVTLLFAIVLAVGLMQTAVFGGLYGSALVVIFDLIIVFGALIAFGVRAASWWFALFIASLVYAVTVPNWIDPLYVRPDPAVDATFNLIATGIVIFATMVYFVRQRDRFQKQSDDLLHNILPEEIASRLKADTAMIADSFDEASVLFADVVGFTPMTATMSPPELVGLLNDVFSTFDSFVEDLGLEKIKTIGDEYMVAAGVPVARPDHAVAIAELALQIRDHISGHEFDGHQIKLRIGINSGPVVAGIIGRHKFAYDLWGDVVNTASRMQSEGVPGSIQVSAATYELLRDRFDFEPRGVISVKGKGEMETYLLVSRRGD